MAALAMTAAEFLASVISAHFAVVVYHRLMR